VYESGITLAGRAASNHIVLRDSRVSAIHCLFAPSSSGGGLVLLDARSKGGMRVNGRDFAAGLVHLGDTIAVGPFELELVPDHHGLTTPRPLRPGAQGPSGFEFGRRQRPGGLALPAGTATVVGRSPFAHIQIDHHAISHYHCLIALDARGNGRMPFLIDLRSTNRTFVNGRAIHRKHVLPGDEIIIGRTRFEIRRADGPHVDATAREEARHAIAWSHLSVTPPPPAKAPPSREPRPPKAQPPAPQAVGPPAPAAPEPVPAPPPPEDIPLTVDLGELAALGGLPADEAEAVEAPAAQPEPTEQAPAPVEPPAPEPAAVEPARREVAPAPPEDEPEPEEAPVEVAETPPPEPPAEMDAPEPMRLETPEAPAEADRVAAAPDDPDATWIMAPLTSPEPPAIPADSPATKRLAEEPHGYEAHFGLHEQPFQHTVDPKYFYHSQCHWEAYTTLNRWVETGPPLAVLYGEHGCGKTFVASCLARRLRLILPHVVLVRRDRETAKRDELVLAAVVAASERFGRLQMKGQGPLEVWHALLGEVRRRHALVTFLIDDAHEIPPESVRELADLAENPADRDFVRILLAGEEVLRGLVSEPPLSHHLGVSCYLSPMEADEVPAYVLHRLSLASEDELPLFTRRAMKLIATYSGGIPRLVNTVADAALLYAFRTGSREVTRELVAQAIDELLPAEPPRPSA
jgi:type II secretory pathway predicted ATPase ExeA/pSer/pThr/pTyr-binding forkhead associated (FHA) protein